MDAEMDSIITNTGVNKKYTMKQEVKCCWASSLTQLTELDKSTGTVHKLFNGCKMLCSVNRSAAYGVQQRRVAALSGRLVHNEISVEQFLSAQSYHTSEPLRL
ncbi:conserved hypothetical protein [Trichinella spiralis]|uniref:hypothetical protein n=1 Tax=Trichinella spiralis TaxID=6334 RepID=UPI0001EFEB01|nr:conserved hypothetical protein [Trichinella spiralis]